MTPSTPTVFPATHFHPSGQSASHSAHLLGTHRRATAAMWVLGTSFHVLGDMPWINELAQKVKEASMMMIKKAINDGFMFFSFYMLMMQE
jgi:hypothetical protein